MKLSEKNRLLRALTKSDAILETPLQNQDLEALRAAGMVSAKPAGRHWAGSGRGFRNFLTVTITDAGRRALADKDGEAGR